MQRCTNATAMAPNRSTARPTEVTVPAGTTVETTITFDKAAELTYVCHLPHHEAYGMLGTLTVT